MTGLYQVHLRCDEKIAAEVELFRQECFPDFGSLCARRNGLGKALYPPKAYTPSVQFLKKLRPRA